ncbi:hypothetical protein CVT24_007871 [Panaeolus cyanescens]|uniref:Uncharacterized protein n=1 Tax=Panaeolus cyanescens TaxID=181874 RepID=A0A409VE62_9AGAR|nr:hypothetical protein CVT24_007871 [Panaeolus cyanescens]
MLGKFRLGDSPAPAPSSPFASLLTSPLPFLPPPTPLSKKRTKSNAENIPPSLNHIPSTPTPYKRPRVEPKTPLQQVHGAWETRKPTKLSDYVPSSHTFENDTQRLEFIFDAIQYVGWSFGQFLHTASLNPKRTGQGRTSQHAQTVSRFLRGQDNHTPMEVVELWYLSSDTRLGGDEEKEDMMYSLCIPYIQIKPFRPALSSFAVQFCAQKIEKEARVAVKSSSGLHATVKKQGRYKLEWKNVGLSTIEYCQQVLLDCLPVAYHLFMQIAGNESPTRRPSSLVTTHALSSLLFTRSNESRLVPLSLGLLSFAYSAPVDLMAYLSRIGVMPAYNTIYTALERLALYQGSEVKDFGRDPGIVSFIQCDID